MRLSNEIAVEDAQVAIDVMSDYLKEVGYDNETETFDIDKVVGVSSSEMAKMKAVLKIISSMYTQFGTAIKLDDLYGNFEQLQPEEVDKLIDRLCRAGSLFVPTRGYVKPLWNLN